MAFGVLIPGTTPSSRLTGHRAASTPITAIGVYWVMKDTFAAARAGYARDGERGLLRNLYAVQIKYYAAGKIPGMTLARTCLRMGKKEEALQLIEQDYARHSAVFLWCLSVADFLSLKDEPRYKPLLRKVNFPAAPQEVRPSNLAEVANPPSLASSEPH